MASLSALTPKAQRFLNAGAQAQKFKQAIKQRETEAALLATKTSRAAFTGGHIFRPDAPARPGRPTTNGQFASFINWQPSGKNQGYIDFDTPGLESRAKYWLIQEIGTNHSATILNPLGHVSVRSQIGRTIPYNLYWAAGVGQDAKNASVGASGDQLFLASDVNAASLANVKSRRKRIRREIKGRHYLQAGGVEGFRYLGETLSSDARKIFK